MEQSNVQVFGFLFSVSKSLSGEYWPLYLGANTLGRDASNSIVLAEATVSETHANIHIISRAGQLIVYVTDSQSKTGTLLNGNLLRGEADLKNGDILTIGENYELLVLLVNPAQLGLEPKAGFKPAGVMPVAAPTMQPYAPNPTFAPNGLPHPQMPGAPMPVPPRPVQSGATVIEGQVGSPAPLGGHTVIMNK